MWDVNVNDYVFSVEPDMMTIKVACPDGKEYAFRSDPELGKIMAIQPYGKKLLIVRDYALETFCAALEPSKFRLELRVNSDRRFIHPRQAQNLLRRCKK